MVFKRITAQGIITALHGLFLFFVKAAALFHQQLGLSRSLILGILGATTVLGVTSVIVLPLSHWWTRTRIVIPKRRLAYSIASSLMIISLPFSLLRDWLQLPGEVSIFVWPMFYVVLVTYLVMTVFSSYFYAR